jgi:outer membrane lipoprotein-sorting protein
MQARWVTAIAVCLGLFVAGTGRADDQSEARAVVDKAIQAMGKDAAAKAMKYKGATMKIKGTVHVMGTAIPYTGDFASQLPEQSRVNIEGTVMGQTFKVTVVVNGDKGWIKLMDQTMDLDKEKLAEEREGNYARWVTALTPLTDKAFTLSPVGEVKVDKTEAIGIKVSRKDHRDINLFFDKKTHLLLKSETRVKDDSGKEVTQEVLYSDYKEVDGIKHPMKITINRDGDKFLDGETTDLKLVEKLDESEFAKP